MAAFVLLLKAFEDEEKVIYRFGHSESSMGKKDLNKITRKFTLEYVIGYFEKGYSGESVINIKSVDENGELEVEIKAIHL